MKQAIANKAIELGFDDVRFTSARPPQHSQEFEAWLKDGRHGTMGWIERNAFKRLDPAQVLNEAKSIITLATSYALSTKEADQRGLRGKIARYAQYADYHDVLAARLKELSEFVNSVGGVETRTLWYVDTGPLLERDLAQRAGLGFAGKHTNLISRKIGNWFFISELITTLELAPDEPEKNRCGTCDKCITACPTGAITSPFQLDARKCISYLTIELKGSIPVELRPAIGNRIYGCDECLAVCPWNRFAKAGRVMAEHSRPDLNMPALLELLQLDKESFKKMFAGTPILRTKRRGLLRNVCVALGNIGDESALPYLERALGDEEPLVVEHAEWAIQEIKKRISKTAVTEPAL